MMLRLAKITMKITLVFLACALNTGPLYALADNQAAVTIDADVSIEPAASFSATKLQFPTIFNDSTGKFFTTDSSWAPGGIHGSACRVSIHFTPKTTYDVSLSTMTFHTSSGNYSVAYIPPDDGLTSRITKASGDDSFDINGRLDIDSPITQVGSYDATATITFTLH